MSSSDFPAAHSMDTAWFAIDAEGHVAIFETGEAGAVPATAYVGEDYGALVEALPRRASEPVYNLDGYRKMATAAHAEPYLRQGSLLVFFSSGAPAWLPAGAARAVRASAGQAAVFEEMPEDVFKRLHDDNACAGCFGFFADDPEAGGMGGFEERGLFRYEHSADNWAAGPYALTRAPSAPLHERELTGDLRKAAVRVPEKFSDLPTLQPVGRWECEAWGPAYVGDDGKLRAIPGREADYAEEYEGLKNDMPAEPPPPVPRKPWWKWW